MRTTRSTSRFPALVAALWALLAPLAANAEDIDIFVAGQGGSKVANVLIILDNTSNWSRNDQHWQPPGTMQGQSELLAIKAAIANLDDKVNVGLEMINDNGGANCCTAGYIRYAMQPMTPANKANLQALLQTIYNNFGTPAEKTASSADYSSPLFDAFKYFGGYTSPAHAVDGVAGDPISSTRFGIPVFAAPSASFSAKADVAAYANNFANYIPPPSPTDATCGGQNFIIFIGNGFPNDDTKPQQNLKSILEGVSGNSAQIALPELVTVNDTKTTSFGTTAACYADAASCTTANANVCGPTYDTCACTTTSGNAGCAKKQDHYNIQGTVTTTTVTPTGRFVPPANNKIRYADEWTRYLYLTDVNSAAGQQNVVTYTIDVFNAKQDADQTALLYSMALSGGGKYFPAKSQADITKDLDTIFAEIRADDSVFSSASLPISATNRALDVNEVYLGMFRPDPRARPVWYGNLKRYKIASFLGDYKLADVSGADAVNPNTGLISDCRTSWWTFDSGKFWKDVITDPSPEGACPSPALTPFDPFSDSPDGPKVEKGGVAEMLRKGNVVGAPTWSLNRALYTKSFATFNTANTGMAQADLDFASGINVDTFGNTVTYAFTDAANAAKTTTIRPTIHGGVVHSRPLPVNYGGGTGTVLYYGSDDGTYRAVNAADGRELWAYVPQEFYATLPRLRQNSPIIKYSFMESVVVDPPAQPKNYHFDGSTGIWKKADNSQVWIYPTMRRGGRMIYAFDVKTPSAPTLKWKRGCPNLADDTGCDADYQDIGQTWSMPNVARFNINGTLTPVIVVGGGYDNCEDGSANAACGTKGSVIYVIDANTGNRLNKFTTLGRVASDVAYIDVDYDGIPDFAYVGDTRGNVYRIDFGLSKSNPQPPASWTAKRVAHTNGANRKFLYAPALVQAYDKVAKKFYVYVALGSGDREQPLASQYPYTTPVTNRFYVYLDDVAADTDANLDDASATMSDFTNSTACGASLVIPGSDKKGWFMDLNQYGIGEQTVTSAVIVGGLLAFSTNRPIPAAANVCAPKGEARGYFVNLYNASGAIGSFDMTCGGDRSSTFAGGGLPPSPVIANVDIDGKKTTVCIGCADKKKVCPPGVENCSSSTQSQEAFTLKPQKRTRVYWNRSGDN